MSVEENMQHSLLPEGAELLNGLYSVRDYIQKFNEKLSLFMQSEKEKRQLLSEQQLILKKLIRTDSAKEKSDYGLFMAGIAFSIVFGVITALSGNINGLIFCVIITAVFAVGKAKNSKAMLNIGRVLLILLILAWLNGLWNAYNFSAKANNVGSFVIYAAINVIAFIVAAIVAAIIVKKYNKKINRDNNKEEKRVSELNAQIKEKNDQIVQHNNMVDERRNALYKEMNDIKERMLAETSSWYPNDYYVLDSVEYFISLVKNHEADTVKEMITAYKRDQYHNQVLNNQMDMRQKLNAMVDNQKTMLENQEEMIKLQKISNVLQTIQCVNGFIIAGNTSAIANNTSAIANNTREIADNTRGIEQNTRPRSSWF